MNSVCVSATRGFPRRFWSTKSSLGDTQVALPFNNGTVALELREQFTAAPGLAADADTTGRRIWPTARLLLNRLLQQEMAALNAPTTVLEVGAGCGLVGMGLAASLPPVQVVLSDSTTEWLQGNLDRNQALCRGRATVAQLRWGCPKDHDALRDALHGLPPLDWIIGSDLLYNPTCHVPLLDTLKEMASPSAQILLAYPQRAQDEANFRQRLEEHEGIWKILEVETLAPVQGGAASGPECALLRLRCCQ